MSSTEPEESFISLLSASPLRFDAVGKDSGPNGTQEDLTLTSFDEDDISLSDASEIPDSATANQSIVSLSDASSVTEENCEDIIDNCQQDPGRDVSTSASLENSITLRKNPRKNLQKNLTKKFKPLEHSTPQKLNTQDTTHIARQSSTVMQSSDDTVLTDTSRISEFSWSLCMTMNVNGCAEQCVKKVHQLNEYAVLCAHSQFQSRMLG